MRTFQYLWALIKVLVESSMFVLEDRTEMRSLKIVKRSSLSNNHKQGYVFTVVITAAFHMWQYRVNDHPYHAPQFGTIIIFWKSLLWRSWKSFYDRRTLKIIVQSFYSENGASLIVPWRSSRMIVLRRSLYDHQSLQITFFDLRSKIFGITKDLSQLICSRS